ncbi:UDP-N-acetylmuramoyl-L-alanine--D-glutamate ligase [Vibrio agarivorans]|uniref:UDP-N-acetylmuramoyl-L-alanine--D-glutamate ligase n=1 Tax=Vibrio agarivorans TaxID=153622 RepID=UPI0025B61509|nr:UDP-N-acetylmuramoyl-L-alanine--D-glutamate ligase [Vibrio agarivorans]MDN3661542.1 UDP-N-acetylmuramoyl-L-alanine--D-glutamate ligase [Vibrio agarivorans]
MNHWQGISDVVVAGLGITGLSVVNYLEKYHPNITVKVIDTRPVAPNAQQLPADVELHTGSWNIAWLEQADLIIANPGIALATPELQRVMAMGKTVVGDIEIFAWHVSQPTLAITGSNGKSTVTDLTGALAKAAGVKVAVGGNIGVPALDLIADDVELYVLELSSFQLETTSSLKLAGAAFLNLSEDHMDRYEGMSDYKLAKLRIFDHAQLAIVNRDDAETLPANDISISDFSLQSTQAQYHVVTIDGREWLVAKQQPVIPVEQLTLVGRHNVANALAAIALLDSVSVPRDGYIEQLQAYNGLTHRCQMVAEHNGVRWVNDSKATNVASTLAALSGLDCPGQLYLLVGGNGKGADFSELKPVLAQLNVTLCCYGADGDEFMNLSENAFRFETMMQAIERFAPEAKAGDIIMLSPACASFDQFPNFMARGDAFTDIARNWQ